MDINLGINYSISRSGEQSDPVPGPQLIKMAQSQEVLPTDHLWADGMSDWVQASSFNQLATIFQSHEDAPAQTTKMEETPLASNPIAARVENTTNSQAASQGWAGKNYRAGASFRLVLFSFVLMLIGLAAYVGTISFGIFGKVESAEGSSATGIDILLDHPYIFYIAMGLMIIGGLFNTIVSLKYLHRAWAYIQDLPSVTTTPGKAVGFLFIPFFNLVWLFFAFHKWAGDYNLRCDLSKSNHGPKANEGLFLAHCIMSLLGLPILYIFVMHQICRSINHLASSPNLELVSNR